MKKVKENITMTNANKILKICAMYNTIKGKQSFFIDTRGAAGSGKTFEDKQVLSIHSIINYCLCVT